MLNAPGADPKAMQQSLWTALRPGGHGIEPADPLAEMRGAGFELVAHHEEWPAEDDSYCIVFRRPAER